LAPREAGQPHTPPLRRNRDFVAFWAGEAVSQVGTQITFVALPLVAVLTLEASVGQLGLLRFIEFLPFLLLTLPFGVLADRCDRRPLMIASHLFRGAMVAVVPICAAAGALQLWALALVHSA
jgi:MFS family permease